MTGSSRLFAVVPAAGRSRRMGQSKLLLPLGDTTVVARLLEVLQRPEISDTVVVVRADDERLRDEVIRCDAGILQPPQPPPDMRHSVEFALNDIRRRHNPSPDDGWLLIPADHPLLDSSVLDRLLDQWQKINPRILVPTCNGRRGHPTIFRWLLAEEVSLIPADQGINHLLQVHADQVSEVGIDNSSVLIDLDTPEDYDRLLGTETEHEE